MFYLFALLPRQSKSKTIGTIVRAEKNNNSTSFFQLIFILIHLYFYDEHCFQLLFICCWRTHPFTINVFNNYNAYKFYFHLFFSPTYCRMFSYSFFFGRLFFSCKFCFGRIHSLNMQKKRRKTWATNYFYLFLLNDIALKHSPSKRKSLSKAAQRSTENESENHRKYSNAQNKYKATQSNSVK